MAFDKCTLKYPSQRDYLVKPCGFPSTGAIIIDVIFDCLRLHRSPRARIWC